MLADVSLHLEAGEFILLVGPNGVGKTTLLRLLATSATPTRGRVEWREDAATLEPAALRGRIGCVAHHPLLYDELTAQENLVFAFRMHDRPNADVAADQWLATFGLTERARDRVGGLSRGLKQRLALARAFGTEPQLLLLDEPGTGLDSKGTETLLAELARVRGRATVVLATHEPDPFRPLATRTLEIRDRSLHDWGGPP